MKLRLRTQARLRVLSSIWRIEKRINVVSQVYNPVYDFQ